MGLMLNFEKQRPVQRRLPRPPRTAGAGAGGAGAGTGACAGLLFALRPPLGCWRCCCCGCCRFCCTTGFNPRRQEALQTVRRGCGLGYSGRSAVCCHNGVHVEALEDPCLQLGVHIFPIRDHDEHEVSLVLIPFSEESRLQLGKKSGSNPLYQPLLGRGKVASSGERRANELKSGSSTTSAAGSPGRCWIVSPACWAAPPSESSASGRPPGPAHRDDRDVVVRYRLVRHRHRAEPVLCRRPKLE